MLWIYLVAIFLFLISFLPTFSLINSYILYNFFSQALIFTVFFSLSPSYLFIFYFVHVCMCVYISVNMYNIYASHVYKFLKISMYMLWRVVKCIVLIGLQFAWKISTKMEEVTK